MRDLNDPQLLGEHILSMIAKGMKATDAADKTYEDMATYGWHFGYGADRDERLLESRAGRSQLGPGQPADDRPDS